MVSPGMDVGEALRMRQPVAVSAIQPAGVSARTVGAGVDPYFFADVRWRSAIEDVGAVDAVDLWS
jgi:hypothetical protein